MKKICLFVVLALSLASCNIEDWWYLYWRKPHHSYDIENRTDGDLFVDAYVVGAPKEEYSSYAYLFEMDHSLNNNSFLDGVIYIDAKTKQRVLRLDGRDQLMLTSHMFYIRFEDIIPGDDGIITYLYVCFVKDLYAVYNGEMDAVPCWRYGYTLADLQRYDWKVPFPDDSGTIKIERFDYVPKERRLKPNIYK